MTHPACIITSVTCSTKFAPHVCVCVVPILPRSVRSGLVPKKNDLDGKWDRGHGRQGRRQENEGKGRPKKKKKTQIPFPSSGPRREKTPHFRPPAARVNTPLLFWNSATVPTPSWGRAEPPPRPESGDLSASLAQPVPNSRTWPFRCRRHPGDTHRHHGHFSCRDWALAVPCRVVVDSRGQSGSEGPCGRAGLGTWSGDARIFG